MLNEIALGAIITLISLSGATLLWWALNELLDAMEPWIRRPPHPSKFFVVMIMVVVAAMTMMTFGVWLWAIVFRQITVFESMEEAVYYSLVAYTTLGLGDVVVPDERRILGGMTGANGFLMFGLMTAMLTDTLRHIRRVQHNVRD